MTSETDAKPPAEGQSNAAPNGAASSIPPSADPPPSMTPPANAQAGAAGDPAELRAEFEALKGERDKLREQLLRTAADFDNFRKRSKRDLDDARERSKGDLVRDLLPVFDNLERAVSSTTPSSDVKSVVDGIRMVLKLFEDSAERLGLSRIKSVGERFDPAQHEAIQQLETAEHAPGTIVREVVAGYRFGERLVRPAMVVVARKPADAPATVAPPAGTEANGASKSPPPDAPDANDGTPSGKPEQ